MNATQSISELFPAPAAPASAPSNPAELGQEDFLELMVAQLENQDPTSPLDNFEFLSQIAQFSTVDGIQGLQGGFAELSAILTSNQTLQAASLVGRNVVTDSNLGTLGADTPLQATVDFPGSAASATLFIQDQAGRLVHSRPLGAVQGGELNVTWDGTAEGGERLPPGQYRVSAEIAGSDGPQAVPVLAHTQVESVSVGRADGSVTLNLASGETAALSSINRFF